MNLIKRLRNIFRSSKKVSLDTNLFIASYWNKHSASSKILRSVIKGNLKFVYTNPIKNETLFVLNKIKAKKEYMDYVEEIFSKGILLYPKRHISVIKDDPEDDKYIDCAVSGKADFIISNDKHLFKLARYGHTRILKPSDFIKLKI